LRRPSCSFVRTILQDISKPFFYRTFIVPEDDARLGELRRLLKRLHDEHGFTLLVSHDQQALAASGVRLWWIGKSAPAL
jgi:hypothetical protein